VRGLLLLWVSEELSLREPQRHQIVKFRCRRRGGRGRGGRAEKEERRTPRL